MEPSVRAPGVRVGSVAGDPVYDGRSWALIALVLVALIGPSTAAQRPDLGLLAYGVAALYAVLLLVAILVHEVAHTLAARAYGLPVLRIVADLWGGHTAFESGHSRPGSAAVIAVVGPLSNAVLALVSWVVLQALPGGIPSSLAGGFALLNLALAGFNLLPGLPLDGGQLVESGVWAATGSRPRGMVVAGWCGRAVTVLVFAWFLGRPLATGRTPDVFDLVWALFISSFLWAGASAAIRGGRALAAVNQVRLAQVLRPALCVRADEPLDQTLARWSPGQAVVVLDDRGQPGALVDPDAVGHVPPGRYHETPTSAVSTPQPRGWAVEVDPQGDIVGLVAVLQTLGAPLVAVTHHGRCLGVVTAADVNRALEHL